MELGWGSSKFASLNPNISKLVSPGETYSLSVAGCSPRFWVFFVRILFGECFILGSVQASKIYTKMLNQWTELSTLKRATSWNAKCPIFLGNFTP